MLALAAWAAFSWWRGAEVPAWQVTAHPFIQSVVATGRVYTPTRVRIGAELTATVKARHVREGELVTSGQILLVLDDATTLARVREAEAALQHLIETARPQAQAELQQVEQQLIQAQREAVRRRSLVASRAIAREALEQAEQAVVVARSQAEQARLKAAALAPGQSEERILRERLAAARAELGKTIIRAPFSGLVLKHSVEPGDVVQPGETLLEIASQSDIQIQLPLDEKNLGLVALNQEAICIAEAFPSRPFPARVTFIAPSVDPQRGTVEVRLTPIEPTIYLVPDMTVSATIATGYRDDALVIPDDTLIDPSGQQAHVLVVRDGVVERVGVQLGMRGTAQSEITSGLNAGDWVLRDTTIAPGRRVRPVPALPSPHGMDGNVGEALSGL